MADIRFQGGVNELNDQTTTLQECIIGENHELAIGNSQLVPRNAFSLDGTHPDGNSIQGILQLIKRDNTQTTLILTGTKADEWDGTSTFTNRGTITEGGPFRASTWQLDDVMIITDIAGNNVVKVWDGTTFGNLTTGLTPTDLYAKYSVIHNGRVWFFNIKTNTGGSDDTPHLIAASAFENHESYDAGTRAGNSGFTGNEAFFLTSPDLKPINGVWVFLEEIVFSTERGRLYKITGDDSTNYTVEPFYFGSAATGDQSFANIGNDSAYMRKDGNIELLRSVETSGDQKANDLSLKIPELTAGLTGAIVVYDERRQKVLFFVSGKVLVCFKEMIPTGLSPWMVYKTQHPNQFTATAANYIRDPVTDLYYVFWGDADGNIFTLDAGDSNGDAGQYTILTKRKIPIIDTEFGPPIRGRVVYRRTNEVPFNIFVEWGDELNEATCNLTLKGNSSATPNFYDGEIYYKDGKYYQAGQVLGTAPVSQGFSPNGRGLAAFITVTSNTTKSFVVDKMVINDSAIRR